jgi:hypothetical protein
LVNAGFYRDRISPLIANIPKPRIKEALGVSEPHAARIVAAITGNWRALIDASLRPVEQDLWNQALNPAMDADDPRLGTISAGTLDQLNDYCSARGRAKFVADWVPGGGTMARTLWGSNNGAQLGFYQLSTADLNSITGENSGGQTVAMHAGSEALEAAAGSTAFLTWLRGATSVPKTLASVWLGRASLALIIADAFSGFYKEGKEILNCQDGN